uniref:Bile acid:sodium symporter n=1 Tax=Chaetoceros debilis TaxID=122233 RepID=A0A7S3V7Q2_9STRA
MASRLLSISMVGCLLTTSTNAFTANSNSSPINFRFVSPLNINVAKSKVQHDNHWQPITMESPTNKEINSSSPTSTCLHAKKGEPGPNRKDLSKTIDVIMKHQSPTPLIDKLLSKLTSLFPFFVLSAAVLGFQKPTTLLWVNEGNRIPMMLSAVMISMGMTLSTKDFTRVLTSSGKSAAGIPAGVSCQYIIMPMTAYLIGTALLMPSYPAAFLGLVLVGCSPGGTASNLVSLIAKADVALSVILTTVSTVLASVLTPLLVKTLVGSAVSVSGWTLFQATSQVVLLPVAVGMIIREIFPKLADFVGRYAPFAGVVLVSLLCGGVVAQNAVLALSSATLNVAGSVAGAASAFAVDGILVRIMAAVLGLHTVGFSVGYLASRKLFGLTEQVSRTISIETGMQNSALAVVLARSVIASGATAATVTATGGSPAAASLLSMACLPGALSATAHSCLGSALAVFWRFRDGRARSRSGAGGKKQTDRE